MTAAAQEAARLPVKRRKCFELGSRPVYEWRYDCHLCRRKGFTPQGFFRHLVNAHGVAKARALWFQVMAEAAGGRVPARP